MYGNYYNYNSIPTATQPYGYPMNPYMGNINTPQTGQVAQSPQNQVVNTNTNKIYVNGIDDVRNKALPSNSDYIFLDNDKAMIYQKVVDGSGHFEVKAFDIIPHVEQENAKISEINLSDYVLRKDFEDLQNEIKSLKTNIEKLSSKEINKTEGTVNGTTDGRTI